MEVRIGIQNCFDQGFKCFARHLAWGWQSFIFTEFNARFDDWCFARRVCQFL